MFKFLLAAVVGLAWGMATAKAADLSPLYYTALGDSITWGEDSSHPCVPETPILMPGECSDGTSYVDLFANSLARDHEVFMQDLGIRGTRIDYLVETSVPKIQPGANLFTLYLGTNDLHDVADLYADPLKVSAALLDYEKKYAALVQYLEDKYPGAKVVLLNVPNLGTLKYFQQWGPAFAKTLSEISIKFDRDFLDTYQKKGYTVVDLACDPESYKPENLYSDGLHPVDSGYRIIAAKLSQYLSAQPPVYPTTCPAVPAQNTGF